MGTKLSEVGDKPTILKFWVTCDSVKEHFSLPCYSESPLSPKNIFQHYSPCCSSKDPLLVGLGSCLGLLISSMQCELFKLL